jgi:hypothetical protein
LRLRHGNAVGQPLQFTGEKVIGREAPGLFDEEEGVALDARRPTIPPVIERRLFPGEGG